MQRLTVRPLQINANRPRKSGSCFFATVRAACNFKNAARGFQISGGLPCQIRTKLHSHQPRDNEERRRQKELAPHFADALLAGIAGAPTEGGAVLKMQICIAISTKTHHQGIRRCSPPDDDEGAARQNRLAVFGWLCSGYLPFPFPNFWTKVGEDRNEV